MTSPIPRPNGSPFPPPRKSPFAQPRVGSSRAQPPPAAGAAGGVARTESARRLTRLAATILDAILVVGAFLPFAFSSQRDNPSGTLIVVCLAALLALLVVNLYFLGRDGQTLGKKALGIRILRKDGSKAGLGRLLLLRWIAPGVLAWIPIAGVIFGLADALFIFGPPRRCIHDYMADTIVVLA